MKYFGVPTCPYCKKRVNLIRTWSLKRQGEYQCPRCGGISNIFLSPLIYVCALLAVFAGGAIYFFHKFILDDISLSITFQVLVPFAIFFLLSLFMVYLVKPVIKKVPKTQAGRKKRGRSVEGDRRISSERAMEPAERSFYDTGDYTPQTDYMTGPMPQMEREPAAEPAFQRDPYAVESQKTSVVDMPAPYRQQPRRRPAVDYAAQSPVSPNPVRKTARSTEQNATQAPVKRPRPGNVSAAAPRRNARPSPRAEDLTPRNAENRQIKGDFQGTQEPRQASRVVSSVEIPSINDDFFAKYDDPAYIERRLQELKEGRGGQDEL